MHTTTLPFQVGEPVEHRGIVVAPLFPLRDRVRVRDARRARSRAASRSRDRRTGDVPELAVTNRSPTPSCSTTARNSSARSRTGSSTSACSSRRGSKHRSLCRASKRAAGAPLAALLRRAATSRTPSSGAKTDAPRGEPLARGAAQGEVWRAVQAKAERMGVPRRPARTATFPPTERELAGLEPAFPPSRGSAAPCSGSGTRSASTRLASRCVRRALAKAAHRVPARRARAAGRARDPAGAHPRVRRRGRGRPVSAGRRRASGRRAAAGPRGARRRARARRES